MWFSAYSGFVFAACVLASLSNPEACLIGAIGKQGEDAADVHKLCSDPDQKYVLGNLTKLCETDENTKEAYGLFAKTCRKRESIEIREMPSSDGGSDSDDDNDGDDKKDNSDNKPSNSSISAPDDDSEGSDSVGGNGAANSGVGSAMGLILACIAAMVFV